MAIPVVIRHVVVPGLTDGADELGKGGRLISAWDNAIAIAPMIFRDAAERVRQKA